jgi:hypothetical protein
MTTDTGALEIGAPKTIEQVAMDKVIDPFSEPYPFWHYDDPEKLMDILKEGIIAENFAKRIRKENYRRRFSSSWNEINVSVTNAGDYGYPYIAAGIFVKPLDRVSKADPSLRQPGDKLDPEEHEHLIKRRIALREFTGVYLGDIFPPGMNRDELRDCIIDYFCTHPDRSLPIYDYRGLTWPVKMSRQQLQGYVKSKA